MTTRTRNSESKRIKYLDKFSENTGWQTEFEKITQNVMDVLCGESDEDEEPPGETEYVLTKVNLPSNEHQFEHGIGEGVWVVITRANFELEPSNKKVLWGKLANQPDYPKWKFLKHGDPVIFETRGNKRPVAILPK